MVQVLGCGDVLVCCEFRVMCCSFWFQFQFRVSDFGFAGSRLKVLGDHVMMSDLGMKGLPVKQLSIAWNGGEQGVRSLRGLFDSVLMGNDRLCRFM